MTRASGMLRRPIAVLATIVTSFLPANSSAHAAELKILSPQVMRSVLDEIVPRFERVSGNQVTISYATSSALVDEIEAGAVAERRDVQRQRQQPAEQYDR